MTLALESASRSRWEAWQSAVPSITKTSNTTVNNRNRPSARKCRFIFPSSAGCYFQIHGVIANAPTRQRKPALKISFEARIVGRDALGYFQLFGVCRVAFLESLGTQLGDGFLAIVAGAEARLNSPFRHGHRGVVMPISLWGRRDQIPPSKRERGGVSELHGMSYRSAKRDRQPGFVSLGGG